MSKNTRIASAITAVVLAALAFIALKPDDKPGTDKPGPAVTATSSSAVTATTTTTAPKTTVIRVKGGEPVGGVTNITVKQGTTMRFTVVADAPEEVHVHGYDVAKVVGPGNDAVYVLPAKINGVFEVELEKSAVQIAKLTVEP